MRERGERIEQAVHELPRSDHVEPRGWKALVVAGRVAALGEVVAAAGVNDVEQGAQLLATSEDIAILGAVVGAISQDDLDRGLEVARVSGELNAVSIVVGRIGMPVLSAFLAVSVVGCQSVEYHAEGNARIEVKNSAPNQERGRNSPPVLTEPDVSVIP